MANNRIHLLELAQEKLNDCIRLLELACTDDGYAKAYLIDHLKIYASNNHGFLSGDINIDKLIEKYRERREDDEEDGAYGHDEPNDVPDQDTEELLERMGLN
jgi:hypothetical protein